MITTKDRKALLQRAVQSALEQTIPVDIYVVDDASTDETSALLRSEFPQVQVRVHTRSQDVARRRNELAQWAPGDILFFLDDDAMFSSPRVIEQTLQEFDDPRIAAVAIPFIDLGKGEGVRQQAPLDGSTCVTASFFGGMIAFRREIYLRLGGYRSSLVHQFEEADLAIRLLDAGYVIRLGRSDPIHHFLSPVRNMRRMGINGARNNVLFAWHNVPMPHLVPHILGTSINSLRAGFRKTHGRPDYVLIGLVRGYRHCLFQYRARQPVRRTTYRLSRTLKGANCCTLQDIEPMLPALRDVPDA